MRVDQGFDAYGITAVGYSEPRLLAGLQPDLELLPRMLRAVRSGPGVEASLVVAGGGPYRYCPM